MSKSKQKFPFYVVKKSGKGWMFIRVKQDNPATMAFIAKNIKQIVMDSNDFQEKKGEFPSYVVPDDYFKTIQNELKVYHAPIMFCYEVPTNEMFILNTNKI